MKQRFTRRWLILLLVLGLAVLAIPAAVVLAQSAGVDLSCAPSCMVSFRTPSIMRPASPEAARIQTLFNFILILAAIVFVVVESLLLFAVLRFRNRPPESAVQVHGNTKLEIAWTAAPGVVLAILLGMTLQTMANVRAVEPENVLNVRAIGHQWWWEFRYEDLGIVTANEMVVPANTVIEVAVESVDVVHAFWAPELFGKMDAVPGYTYRVRFVPTVIRDDFFGGQCAEYCGTQHAQMRFAVVVRSPADFQAWAANQQQEPAAEPVAVSGGTGDPVAGRALFLDPKLGCIGCHVVQNTAAVGQTGPNLTHLASRAFIAGGVLANTPENLRAWIKDTQTIKPGVLMPSFSDPNDNNPDLTDQQIADIVAYLTTLK